MKVAIGSHFPCDVIGNEGRLFSRGIELFEMELGALASVGPQRFFLSLHVVADHRVRGVQNGLCGTIVLLEFDDQRVGIHFFKIQNIADIGAPEAVDGLIVVSDDAEIAVSVGQEPYQFKLGVVGILVLIHHDIAKTVLVVGEHFVMRVE